MEQVQMFVALISSIVVLLSALVGFVLRFMKAVKSKDLANNKIVILAFLMQAIKDAEALKNSTGAEKWQWVLKQSWRNTTTFPSMLRPLAKVNTT